MPEYRNQIVVVVGLILPRRDQFYAVRRKENPVGGIAMPGGFVMEGENWRDALAREIWEETNIRVATDEDRMRDLVNHSTPDGTKLLLFAKIEAEGILDVQPFQTNKEVSELLKLSVDLYQLPQLCYPLHTKALRKYRDETFTTEDSRV